MYNIIGSGIAGLACSYVLSNFDVKTTIEKVIEIINKYKEELNK